MCGRIRKKLIESGGEYQVIIFEGLLFITTTTLKVFEELVVTLITLCRREFRDKVATLP